MVGADCEGGSEEGRMEKERGDNSEDRSFCTRVYPKVSGLAAWSENCNRYSSL